ncbi:potassium-transporting ATPase subunit KdpC [Legionella jordanis]|nr:potassium-transporting ATPase subunit KdpC [Legionella jordanis]RMX20963.1 potassium-transporting ATPase subunit KdpC [Legionella jordanis]HAT8713707.1 potassium-transporting ATPase subunit KdpC [Legionella jordanis]
MREFFKQLKSALLALLFLTTLTGIFYPLLVTAIAQIFFPWRANGSLVEKNGQIVGSALLGQTFNAPHYFWSRPSATAPFPYNAANSSGSNMAPSNPEFLKTIDLRVRHMQQSALSTDLIPVDLVTASGSGLDPDISPLAAYYQIHRVAKARGVSEQELQQLVDKQTAARWLEFLGEPRVNVLQLNLALDELGERHAQPTAQSR